MHAVRAYGAVAALAADPAAAVGGAGSSGAQGAGAPPPACRSRPGTVAAQTGGPTSVAPVSDAAGRPGRSDPDSGTTVPIEGHSLLSDQRTAAIVTPDARVVWLCSAPDRLASPCWPSLLGGPDCRLLLGCAPLEAGGDPAQRYVGHSLVLETWWDAMSVVDYLDCSEGLPDEPAGRSRLVRVLAGTGKALVEFTPFPGSGSNRLERGAGGIEVRNVNAHLVRLRAFPDLEWHIEIPWTP